MLPEGALEQIPVGATQEQVLIVLGTPSTVATVNGEAFYYISQKTERTAAFMPQEVIDQRVVAVYFDKDRRVDRLANYGVKDGKVFDFVSNTTPTGGQELSYLRGIFGTSGRDLDRRLHDKRKRARIARALFFCRQLPRLVSENRQQQQRHDVGDLDHRVDGRTRRVLVGIADSVAGHRGLVRVATLLPSVDEPSSMYFLALSQAPPPEVIEMATNRPVTMTPRSDAPSAAKPADLRPPRRPRSR